MTRAQKEAGTRYTGRWATMSSCLGITILAFIVGLIGAGCSGLGYITGCAIDYNRRETIPVSRLELLLMHQEIWLTLRSGEVVSGRLVAKETPDSLSIEYPTMLATSDPFARMQHRVLARDTITRIQVPAMHYRWLGLAVGAGADLTVVYLVASNIGHDHPFLASALAATRGTRP